MQPNQFSLEAVAVGPNDYIGFDQLVDGVYVTKKIKASVFIAAVQAVTATSGTVTGDPNGQTAAYPGSMRYDATAKIVWVKEEGQGDEGWIQMLKL